jgi:general secretion pathway protein K
MRRQHGMAVVMALLLVALSASVSALVLWQQRLWLHQVELDHHRAQMRLWLDAQLVWAASRLCLAGVVTLSQPWAQPFHLREQQYVLDARLLDMQARLNLNALALPGGIINQQQLAHYRQLLLALQLPLSLADALVQWRGLQRADQPVRVPALPRQRALDDWDHLLQVPGYTPALLARLQPYAAVLEDTDGRVNLNTAPLLLLQAMLPQQAGGVLAQLVAQREQPAVLDEADFRARLNAADFPAGSFTTTSRWFLLQATVRHGRYGRGLEALFHLDGRQARLVWRRHQALLPLARVTVSGAD